MSHAYPDTPEDPTPALPPGSQLTVQRHGEHLVIVIPGTRSIATVVKSSIFLAMPLGFVVLADPFSWPAEYKSQIAARAGYTGLFLSAAFALWWIHMAVSPALLAYSHQQLVVTPRGFELRRLLGSRKLVTSHISAQVCAGPTHGRVRPYGTRFDRDGLVIQDGKRTLSFADHLSAEERQWIVDVVEQEAVRLRFADLRGG